MLKNRNNQLCLRLISWRPLYLWASMILVFNCSPLQGQSLEHEAWALGNYINNPKLPSIHVNNPRNWTLNNSAVTNDTVRLSKIKSYYLRKASGFEDTTSIELTYGDSLITAIVDSIIRIDNLPNKLALSGSSRKLNYTTTGNVTITGITDSLNPVIRKGFPGRTVSDGSVYTITEDQLYTIQRPDGFEGRYHVNIDLGNQILVREIPKWYRLYMTKMGNKVKIHLQMDFNKIEIIKNDFYEIAGILSIHNNFLDTVNTVHDLIKTYEAYESNPYLYPLLQNTFYNYNLDRELRLMDFDQQLFNKDINQNKDQNYSWINEMYALQGENIIEETEKKDQQYYLNLEPENNSSVSLLTSESDQANHPISKEFSLNQTAIIAGLSDFILERAKEELSMTYLQKFKENLNDGKYPEYRTLFPRTTSILLDFDISNYKVILDGVRQAFSQDISNLGLNLPKLIQLEAYTKDNEFSNELYNVALFFNLINQIYADKSIDQILISSYRQLEKREKQLNEIINLELANEICKDTTQSIVDSLANKLVVFNNSLNKIYETNISTQDQIVRQIRSILSDPASTKELKTNVRLTISDLNKIGELKSHFNLIVSDQSVNIFDYINNYTYNYIQGQGYYGGFLRESNYSLNDFNRHFESQLPDSIYILKGLEQIKGFNDTDYHTILIKWSKHLVELTSEVEKYRIQLEYIKERALFNQAKLVFSLDSIITNGLNQEIVKYESEGIQADINFDLAALSYLSKLSANNRNWVQLKDFLPASSDTSLFNSLAQKNISRDSFQYLLKEHIIFLDTIKNELPKFSNDLNKSGFSANNEFIKQFDELIIESTTVDSAILKPFTSLKDSLTIAIDAAPFVSNSKKNLEDYYNLLKNKVDSNKVRCLENTKGLLGLTEFATHILYSLQDTFLKSFPILQLDTAQVSYSYQIDDTTATLNKRSINSTIVSSISNETTWLSEARYQNLFNNDEARTIYLGLLYQQLRNLKHSDGLTIDNLPLFTTKALNAILNINQSRTSIELKKSTGQAVTFNDRYPLLKSIVDLVSLTLETPFSGDQSLADKDPILKAYLDIVEDGLSLYNNLSKKEYTSAVYNAVSIFKVVASQKKTDSNKNKDRVDSERLMSKLATYGSFMSEVVKAQTPDQVKAALYNVAAPAGSSRIKREYMTNFSLNSYLGVAGGLEYRKVNNNYQQATSIALSVPIGFSFSWKVKNNNSGSWSVFAPILDIGAVTAFRFDDNDVSDLPDLSFQNFISPGVFILRNIPNSPFTLGAGYQYGPTVRNISDDMTELASTYRLLLSLTIDVPLLNFSSGKKAVTIKN